MGNLAPRYDDINDANELLQPLPQQIIVQSDQATGPIATRSFKEIPAEEVTLNKQSFPFSISGVSLCANDFSEHKVSFLVNASEAWCYEFQWGSDQSIKSNEMVPGKSVNIFFDLPNGYVGVWLTGEPVLVLLVAQTSDSVRNKHLRVEIAFSGDRSSPKPIINRQTAIIGNSSYDIQEIFGIQTAGICVICLTEPVQIALAPCRHACACFNCAERLLISGRPSCPVCREDVRSVIRFLIE